jgi:hypothetical protein
MFGISTLTIEHSVHETDPEISSSVTFVSTSQTAPEVKSSITFDRSPEISSITVLRSTTCVKLAKTHAREASQDEPPKKVGKCSVDSNQAIIAKQAALYNDAQITVPPKDLWNIKCDQCGKTPQSRLDEHFSISCDVCDDTFLDLLSPIDQDAQDAAAADTLFTFGKHQGARFADVSSARDISDDRPDWSYFFLLRSMQARGRLLAVNRKNALAYIRYFELTFL